MPFDREDIDFPTDEGKSTAERLGHYYRLGREAADRAATRPRRSTYVSQRRFHLLYDIGLTDDEMEAAFAVSCSVIIAIRAALSLPPNSPSPSPSPSAVPDARTRLLRLRALVAAKCEDVAIARVLHVRPAQVAALRGEWDLPANVPPPATPDDCWVPYIRGLSDAAIAAATGLAVDVVLAWREEYGLTENE